MGLDGQLTVSVSGGTVQFDFMVTNSGTSFLELEFHNGLMVDFVVHENSLEIWRWSNGRMVTQQVQTVRLEPGESITYTAEWTSPESGQYQALAILNASNTAVDATQQFTVP